MTIFKGEQVTTNYMEEMVTISFMGTAVKIHYMEGKGMILLKSKTIQR